MREADGLAMSSRNRRLTESERSQANKIHTGLKHIKESYGKGERDPSRLKQLVKNELENSDFQLEYVEIRAQHDLKEFENTIDQPSVCFVAAKLGSVRLIDNMELES